MHQNLLNGPFVDEAYDAYDDAKPFLTDVLSFDVRCYNASTSTYADASYSTTFAASGTPPAEPPLRGIQVTIRCVEPASRQVRQVTVVHTFVR